MAFYTEETGYEKTSLSDLQGAWENFRQDVLTYHPFSGCDRIIFHVHEAMSWECVRNLKKMKDIYILIRNITIKCEKSVDLKEDLAQIKYCLDEAIKEHGPV